MINNTHGNKVRYSILQIGLLVYIANLVIYTIGIAMFTQMSPMFLLEISAVKILGVLIRDSLCPGK